MSLITERILNQLGDSNLINKLLLLSKSDLNSLFLEIFKKQTAKISPSNLMASYETNRFLVPSEADPIKFHLLEAELLSLAEKMKIKNVLLSPVAPLGSCSSFGCVDQYNIISGVRGVETLSDPTNMLAILISNMLKNKQLDNKIALHYATTARVVRAQPFSGEGFYSHFGLFCLVSSGKDKGSYICEKELLAKHLNYYKKLFLDKYNYEISVVLRKRNGYVDSDTFFEKISEFIKKELPDTPISFDLAQEENQYYKGLNFKIYIQRNDEMIEIGDGGFVNWISKVTNNKKERCLISGIGIDRLLLF